MKSLSELIKEYKIEKKQGNPITDLIKEFQVELNKNNIP